MLAFSTGNGKLAKDTLIFDLPAGKTCPGALLCKSFAVVGDDGKRRIVDGDKTQFRCFAASSEVQYDAVYEKRAQNLSMIVNSLQTNSAADLIHDSIQHHRTRKTAKIRIHSAGDFFSGSYLDAWIDVAQRNPNLKFYCYTKSLQLFQYLKLPSNFYMTASYGGKWDALIDAGHFARYAKVVKNEQEAQALDLEVDHDDSHCFGDKPFALLVHGTQPKGSDWGKAIQMRRKNGQFAGYSTKTKVTA